jgi:hypothetical protein
MIGRSVNISSDGDDVKSCAIGYLGRVCLESQNRIQRILFSFAITSFLILTNPWFTRSVSVSLLMFHVSVGASSERELRVRAKTARPIFPQLDNFIHPPLPTHHIRPTCLQRAILPGQPCAYNFDKSQFRRNTAQPPPTCRPRPQKARSRRTRTPIAGQRRRHSAL